jgi:hypothetical protein
MYVRTYEVLRRGVAQIGLGWRDQSSAQTMTFAKILASTASQRMPPRVDAPLPMFPIDSRGNRLRHRPLEPTRLVTMPSSLKGNGGIEVDIVPVLRPKRLGRLSCRDREPSSASATDPAAAGVPGASGSCA